MKKYLAILPILTLSACTIPDWMQSSVQTVVYSIAGVVALLVGFAGNKAIQYLSAKTSSEGTNKALFVVDQVVQSLVLALIEEYKNKLVETMKDGKIDAKEAEELKQLAVKVVKERVNSASLKQMAKDMGLTPEAVQGYILDKLTHLMGDKLAGLVPALTSSEPVAVVAKKKTK